MSDLDETLKMLKRLAASVNHTIIEDEVALLLKKRKLERKKNETS